MTAAFLAAALCYGPLLARVLDKEVTSDSATLAGFAVFWSPDCPSGWLSPRLDARADGWLLADLSGPDVARLDYFHAVFGLFPHRAEAAADTGLVSCRIWLPDAPRAGAAWQPPAWQSRWAGLLTATAGDIMDLSGQRPAADLRHRLGAMLVRGASRVRAAGTPATLRHRARPQDTEVVARHQPYARFFAVEEYDLRFRQFDDSMSVPVNRAVFVSGDAVTVLPYDPLRDRVLLIEQFRVAPLARGDDQPWLLEAIAGRIDPGETPEEAARREAVEEAGLTLGQLLKVASYYPTPGAKAEFLYSYVALADLPDDTAGTFGLADEAEDIRSHLVSFSQLMALVENGEAANAPLILTALWLARERPRLRR